MDEATLRAICLLFGLGEPRGAAAPVPGGLSHLLWRVETGRGVFAVKQINRDWGAPDYVAWYERAFSLERAAFDAGVPMPRPVPVAATGACLGEVPGEPPLTVRVHEWVEGTQFEQRVHPPAVAATLGAMLGRIHALRMAAGATPAEALPVRGSDHWSGLAGHVEAAGAEWAPEVRALLPPIGELEAYLREAHADPTPLLLSHRDSDAKNYLRTPAGGLVLVDWDSAGPVNPRQDLANQALTCAGVHVGDPDRAVARAFVESYRRGGGVAAPFARTDLAELVSARLTWFDFNVRRALGERVLDDRQRAYGRAAVRRNTEQIPRFVRSLDAWLAAVAD